MKFSLGSFSCWAVSLERDVGREGRGSYLYLIKTAFIHWDHPLHRNNANAENSSVRNPFHVWYLMPILTVIKATETNAEALNLNTVSPERSLWLASFPCCHSSKNDFTNSHQPSTSKLDPSQTQAVLLKSGQRGGRVAGASVGRKHAGTDGQQLEEVWTRWQRDIWVVN